MFAALLLLLLLSSRLCMTLGIWNKPGAVALIFLVTVIKSVLSCSLVWWQLLLTWCTFNPYCDSGCGISPISFQLSWEIWQPYLLFHLFSVAKSMCTRRVTENHKGPSCYQLAPFSVAFARVSAQIVVCGSAGRAARWKWKDIVIVSACSDIRGETMKREKWKEMWCLKLSSIASVG